MASKEKEDIREISPRIDATPQELASTPVDVVMHEVPAQTGNEGDESVPHSMF